MNYTKLTEDHIGKEIIMFREPTAEEWKGIGEVDIENVLLEKTILKTVYSHKSIETTIDMYSYPTCCFCLFSEFNQYKYELY